MAENYISQFYTWVTGNTITAARLNGNINNVIDGLSAGIKTINVGKFMVAGVEVVGASRELTGTILTIDNLKLDANTISSTSGNIILAPIAGSDVLVSASHFQPTTNFRQWEDGSDLVYEQYVNGVWTEYKRENALGGVAE